MVKPANIPAWPDNLVEARDAREWIAAALADRGRHPSVTGPVEVYRQKDWGVTARFVVDLPPRDVVFKACDLAIFAPALATYRLLAAEFPEQVPHLLAATLRGEQSWSLFRRFPGRPLAPQPTLADLQDIARTMAAIQVRIAAVPSATLPTFPTARIPLIFDELLADSTEYHPWHWYTDADPDAARFGLPDDVVATLVMYRPHVVAWAAELAAAGWPDSLDHVDLRAGNAHRLADPRTYGRAAQLLAEFGVQMPPPPGQ